MVFPTTALPYHVEINPTGSAWVDISTSVNHAAGIDISYGEMAEGSQSQNAECRLVLKNTNGDFTPNNPMGTYYPNFRRNTPLRVYTEFATCYLYCPDITGSYASTPDHADLDITGDIDVRIDAEIAWGDNMDLMGKYADSAGQYSWCLFTSYSRLYFRWSANGTALLEVASTEYLTLPPGRRMAVRATLDVNNGASGNTVTFYISDTMDGDWTQLGEAVVTAGTTSIFSSTSPLYVGAVRPGSTSLPVGKIYEAKVLSGIAGTEQANPDFSAQANGTTSFNDAAGQVWTINGSSEITYRNPLFSGRIADPAPTADLSNTWKTCAITANGPMRRLQRSNSPLQSTLRRAIPNIASLLAYWPGEDLANAESIAAGISGVSPMSYDVAPTFATYSTFEASDEILEVNAAALRGIVPVYTDTNSIQVRFLVHFPATGMANGDVVCSIYTAGTLDRIDLQWLTAGAMRVMGYDSDGTLTHTGTSIAFGAVDVNWRFSIELTQNGADVDYGLWAIAPGAEGGGNNDTLSACTIHRCKEVRINPNKNCATDMAIGHITVQSAIDSLYDLAEELDAWRGEAATARIARLCDEESITARVEYGYPTSKTMGAQRTLSLVELLRECETADMGILFEARDVFGIRYISRTALWRNLTDISLDVDTWDLSDQLTPSYDDSLIVNSATVSRPLGSSATYSDAASIASVEKYDVAVEANINSDSTLIEVASWLVSLGIVDDPRFPYISVNRARAAITGDSATDLKVQKLDVGSRIEVANPPTWATYNTIAQQIIGVTDFLSRHEHTRKFICRPQEPWNVGTYSDTDGIYNDPVDRYDTAGSDLSGALDSDDTTFDVDVTSGPLWTIDDTDFPFDIMIGGERITISDIADSASPQTFTASARSVNGVVKSHSAGAVVTLADPCYYG